MTGIDLGIPQLTDVRLVGSGGYSDVFVARHEGLGRRVAVKVVPRIDDPQRLAEFEAESAAMGRLSDHPNVVVPLSAGATESGDRYLLLEYYGDGSCAELVERSGPLDPTALGDWVRQVGGALRVAHDRGVVHNDVKPENILVRLTAGGVHYAVTDFGLAHLMDGHTAKGVTAGSLLYIAPELLDGQPPGPASDVYGLAATACHMANGSAPFRRGSRESWISLVRRITMEPVDPEVTAHLPTPLSGVVAAALVKSPADRPPLDQVLEAADLLGLAPPPVAQTPPPSSSLAASDVVRPVAVEAPTTSPVDRAADAAGDGAGALLEDGSHPDEPDGREDARLPVRWFILLLVALFAVSVVVGSLFR